MKLTDNEIRDINRYLEEGKTLPEKQVGLNEMKPNKRILNPYWMVLGFVILNPTYLAMLSE